MAIKYYDGAFQSIGKLYDYDGSYHKIKKMYDYDGSYHIVYLAEKSLPKLSSDTVQIVDSGIGVWGGITYSEYFEISDYTKLSGYLGVCTHAHWTSSYGINGIAHLKLYGASTIDLGTVSVNRYYGGDSTNGKNINYNIPSNLRGQYRIGIQMEGFRENTNSATQGYTYGWFENILLS